MTESRETKNTESIELLIQKGKEEVENLLELSEIGFFGEGKRYGFEQVLGEDGGKEWMGLPEEEKAKFLNGMGQILGVELVNIRPEDVLRRGFQEGVDGEITEDGAEVTVLKTKYPEFEIHVMKYRNPNLPRYYDIVRTA